MLDWFIWDQKKKKNKQMLYLLKSTKEKNIEIIRMEQPLH